MSNKIYKISTGDKIKVKDNSSITGRVTIHQKNNDEYKLIEDTKNLVVYRGRNFLIQRALNKSLTSNTARAGWKNNWINLFALGTGGALVDNPLVPLAPGLADSGLYTHANAGVGGIVDATTGYRYLFFDSTYPQIISDSSVTESLTGDTAYDSILDQTYNSDKFLIGLIRISISTSQYNGSDYLDLNEAGLFLSNSNSVPTDIGLFAHTCFASIRKDVTKELLFSWYLYF